MAKETKNNAYNSSFMKTTKKSGDSTEEGTASNSSILDSVSRMLDDSVLKYLKEIASNLDSLTRDYSEATSSSSKKKENRKGSKGSDSKINIDEDKSKKELKNQKKIAKIQKSLEKSKKRKEKIKSGVKSLGRQISPEISIKELTDSASKILTSNSILVDKNLRAMQVGMGLSNNQAMALSGAMDMLGIQQSDLAYLTSGQREALNTVSSKLENMYNTTDTKAISKLGNSVFMIQTLLGVLKTTLTTKLQEVLTGFQPVLDAIQTLLGEVIDSVVEFFDSDEMGQVINMLTDLSTVFVSSIMPALEELLPIVLSLATSIMSTIVPIITKLVPTLTTVLSTVMQVLPQILTAVLPVIESVFEVINTILPVIMQILTPILNIFTSLLSPLMQMISTSLTALLQMISPILNAVITIVNPILEFIQDNLTTSLAIFDSLKPIFNVIGNVIQSLYNLGLNFSNNMLSGFLNVIKKIGSILSKLFSFIKPMLNFCYSIFANIYNAVIAVYNALNGWGQDKDYISTTLDLDIDSSSETEFIPDSSKTASTYSGSNNTETANSTISQDKNITINATYNQSISGTASEYAVELQKQNYSSNIMLANIVDGGSQ